jgi:hypothetical protein
MVVQDTARKEERPAELIRVWAYEFGDCPDPLAVGRQLEFRDLRASCEFPGSALSHAQLMAITIRRADLWRLIDPAASDGAIVVWPSSPPRNPGPGCGWRSPIETIATRVISLVRVEHPGVVPARRRASLNVRSVVFAEDAWRRHAGSLLTQAIHILRVEFDAAIDSQIPVDLSVGPRHAPFANHVLPDEVGLLRQAMTSGASVRLGQDAFKTESAFWTSASEALRHTAFEARESVSLAYGFAEPYVPARICCSLTHHKGSTTAVECLVGDEPAFLHAERGSAGRLVQLHARHREPGERAVAAPDPAAQASPSHSDGACNSNVLDRLEERVRVALRFPPGDETASGRAPSLLDCEGDLVRHLALNGFLLPHELDLIQQSPALSALVRHIIDSKPHLAFSRLQISLTILAACGPAILDECLRKLLPPAWPATELLESITQRWALRQALSAIERADGLAAQHAAELRDMLLARLSCHAFAPSYRAARGAPETAARSKPS